MFAKLQEQSLCLASKTSPNQRSRSWDFSKPGYLDLFSVCRGVAKVVSKTADTWALCMDIAQDPQLNLLDAELREKLELLIAGGVFFAVGAAPVCRSFSIAVTPPVRDATFPQGKPGVSNSGVGVKKKNRTSKKLNEHQKN